MNVIKSMLKSIYSLASWLLPIDTTESLNTTESLLGKWADSISVARKVWMDEPTHLNNEDYLYDPVDGLTCRISNYSESDRSYRKRIEQYYTRQVNA